MRRVLFIWPLLLLFWSCQHNSTQTPVGNKTSVKIAPVLLDNLPNYPVMSLIDTHNSKEYTTITIGDQTWITSYIKSSPMEGKVSTLYNWNEAIDACPESFTIPSDDDWGKLFTYINDSIISRATPSLILLLSSANIDKKCKECGDASRKNIQLSDVRWQQLSPETKKERLSLVILERIGFCTLGSGFEYNRGSGKDDFSYFWTSTVGKNGHHKYISIFSGDYCNGCGYKFAMPFNDTFRFNLKCIKKS